MFADLLTLTTVQVQRETVTDDGMGGTTITTTATTILKSALWASGTGNRWMSDRVSRASTHVLACEPNAYTWTQEDRNVLYGGQRYKIIGRPDNVMQQSEIIIVPLELVT